MRTPISKNFATIEQLQVACRHVDELMAVGVTENIAIRILEVMTETYARAQTAHPIQQRAHQIKLWSVAAQRQRDADPSLKPSGIFIVEHGTPRRAYTRMVMALNANGTLNEETMRDLVRSLWKVAVITVEEDARLRRLARSKAYETPDERWAAAGIAFPSEGEAS